MKTLARAWKPYWQKRGGKAEWPWIRFVAACVPTGSRVLDVGCGDGQLLAALGRKGCRAEGIDVVHEAVAYCKRRGLRARAGDFLTARFAGGYDAVALSEVLAFVPEPERFLRRARQLLKAGGLVVVSAGNAGSVWSRIARARGKLPPEPEPPLYYRRFTQARLERLAESGGLRVAKWNSFSWWPRQGPRKVRLAHALRARHFVAVLEPTE